MKCRGNSNTILRATLPNITVWKDLDSLEWILLVDWEIFSGLIPTEEFPSAISSKYVPPQKFQNSQNISLILTPCIYQDGFFDTYPNVNPAHTLQQVSSYLTPFCG
jgi:hypothetical protein